MVVFPVWGVAYAAGYSLLGVPGYTWYRLPILFVLSLVAGLGLEAVVRTALSGRKVGGFSVTVAGVLTVALMVSAGWRTVASLRALPQDRQIPPYMTMARWLNADAKPGQSVAFFEVGALGYYTDLAVVDLVGLVTPSMIPHVLNQDFSSGFWGIMPDYLIELEGSEFTRAIVENPAFSGNYSPAVRIDGSGGRPLTIYRSRHSNLNQ